MSNGLDTDMADHDQYAENTSRFLEFFKKTQPFFNGKIELADLREHNRGRGISKLLPSQIRLQASYIHLLF